MSENKFTDTLNQLLDQLETAKTEIEKQNARVSELEGSNKELLEALKHARSFIIRYGTIKEGAGFVDSPMFSSLYEKMSGAINKAEEEQNNE